MIPRELTDRDIEKISSREFGVRFHNKVELIPFTTCHWWIGSSSQKYGQISVNGNMVYSHRVAYLLSVGDIPNGISVCHKCDNPGCVNPDHLFIGTHRENMEDMAGKGRSGGEKRRGANNTAAKLTASQVLEIRNSTEPAVLIASNYGVCESTVYLIKSRKIWSHI